MSESSEHKIDCPVCNGTGRIDKPAHLIKLDLDGKVAAAAQSLRKEGYTIREIAKVLGYKHPGSISHLLSKNHKA
jgi:AraC-like DNA-binding protein